MPGQRKKLLVRLSVDNYSYLCKLAERNATSLAAEINRMIAAERHVSAPVKQNAHGGR